MTTGDEPPPSGVGPATIDVMAAVIRDERGRHLLGLRPARKRHGGLWEFPGGKVDPGETRATAIARELDEELGVRVVGVGEALRFARVDPGGRFRILFVEVRIEGTPVAREHDELRWLTPAEMTALPLAPTDRAFADRLLREDGD